MDEKEKKAYEQGQFDYADEILKEKTKRNPFDWGLWLMKKLMKTAGAK